MKKICRSIVLAIAILALPCASYAKPPTTASMPVMSMPVMVGGQVELDACTSIGRSNGAVIVRVAPRPTARATDTLAQAHLIWICAQRGESNWYGIVYGPIAQSRSATGLPPSCGVDAPVATSRAYRGPCKSGWVPRASLTMIAG